MTGMLIDADSGDLLIENGHIAIGDTEAQTAEAVVTGKSFPKLYKRPLTSDNRHVRGLFYDESYRKEDT